MKPRNIYATAPDGTILKRRTANDYAFAVLVIGRDDTWKLESCSGRRDLAEKSAARFRNFGYRTVIVPVRETKDES